MYITNNLGINIFNKPIQNGWMGYQSSPLSFGATKLERSPICDEVSFSGKKQEPLVTYVLGYIDKIYFHKPTSLKDISNFLLNPNRMREHCFGYDEIRAMRESKFADTKITQLVGNGASAFAFLMEDGRVLKITNCNHFRRKHEDFDIPVYEKGNLPNKYFNDLHYYIEQYANPENVSKKEIKEVVKKIKAKGYKTVDISSRQFGKTSDGKVYLLDPECAYKE